MINIFKLLTDRKSPTIIKLLDIYPYKKRVNHERMPQRMRPRRINRDFSEIEGDYAFEAYLPQLGIRIQTTCEENITGLVKQIKKAIACHEQILSDKSNKTKIKINPVQHSDNYKTLYGPYIKTEELSDFAFLEFSRGLRKYIRK